ncbi:PDZ domain-containing protein 8 isoform X1 [Hydra vulgaris]|uniref:PDZ domain-containing protein 8 isoform X1 n=1 Tax=Hydra vulgaris TaxID=6087 RepID=UPI001F5E6570|nr:PDZ domain-containing protein 8 isoform X1 [Hydra vulgaris]
MLVLLAGFLGGIAFILIVEIFVVYKWFQVQPNKDPKLVPQQKPVSNPRSIAEFCSKEGATEKESCMFLNLIFQFLWKEWRDSPKTRNFFICKMNMEFKEMLLNKAAGKLIDQISVCDYYLGDSLPVFKNATVMKVDTSSPTQVPKELDIAVDVEYSGGFIISLDVGLIFGKSAHFTVELNSLTGRLRLQLTRNPCTHWSFSFYEVLFDPLMDLKVESDFEGKNLPKLTTFISNQIRKSIKKKHTLPNYKVRYKPFFVQEKPQDGKNEIYYHNSLITVGKLDIEIVECTRLPPLPKGSHIYCTLSLDSLPWKEDMPLRRSLWPVHEVLICRAPSGVIGISFFQEVETLDDEKIESVLIKTVTPNSPASHVDVQIGDILISVNNVDVVTMKQAVRLIKNAGNKFTLKLQRPPTKKNTDALTAKPKVEETKDQEDNINTQVKAKDGFDFNSILLHDEDSETEEFVNIVVHEIEKELFADEATKKFINEVKLLRHSSMDIKDSLNVESKEDTLPDKVNLVTKTSDKNSKSSSSPGSSEFKTSAIKKKRRFSLKNSFKKKALKLEPVIESDSCETSDHSSFSADSRSSNKEQGDETYTSSDTKLSKFSEPDDKMETKCSKDWDNISQQTADIKVENEFTQTEDDKEPTGQRTSIASANQEPVWNEIFSFDVEREHKFLNICVWGKCEDAFDKDLLLGYVSIPLMDLSLECLSTKSRKSIQTFLLAVTESRSAISRSYLRVMMPGLNHNQCNGDITLAYKYVSLVPENDLKNLEAKQVEEDNKKVGFTKVDDKDSNGIIHKEHNFIGTDFYFPTRCEYCQRKVWRKVAFQCRVCAMVCHKRCLQKAQNYTYCTSFGVRAKPPVWQKYNPPTVEAQDGPIFDQSRITTVSSEPEFQNANDSWNIPEEYDLFLGHETFNTETTLRRRRFSNDSSGTKVLETDFQQSLDDSISRAKVTAKEAGRELCASLDEENRELYLQRKLEEFQKVILAERYNQEYLKETVNSTVQSKMKESAVEKLRKSEDRVQGLTLLMIQYGAALNECYVKSHPQQCDL